MAAVSDIDALRRRAQRRLPGMIFDYLEGGADDEAGLRRNRAAFDAIQTVPRRLVDVSQRRQQVALMGREQAAPLVVAPTGLNGVLWPDGDVALARAAAACGIPFVLSTASNATIEEVAERAGGELWFQLYVVQRSLADTLVRRALAAGYTTLVLTVDVAVNGKRKRDLRNGFSMPFRYTPGVIADVLAHPRWLLATLAHGMPQMRNVQSAAAGDMAAQAALIQRAMDASFNWDDLARLRASWPHRLLVKGILSVEDAQRCMACGVDGVVLSNHGGRQLESLAAPVEVLAQVADAVNGTVLLDSGVRSGLDVIKSVALGADAVLLGRAVLYGLAAAGEQGAVEAIRMIKSDIDRCLALLGCPDIAGLDRGFIR